MSTFAKCFPGWVATLLFAGLAVLPVLADPTISGSIAFDGTPVFGNPDSSQATNFTALNNATVNTGQQLGDYSAIPDGYSAAFTPFIFVPATIPVSPLWQLTYNGTTYSFFATSMSAVYYADLGIWNIGGSGFARISNFADTPATWNLSTGQIGQSYHFGFSSVAIPEPSAAGLIVLGLSCAWGWRRRARQT